LVETLQKLVAQQNITPQYICCDDAGKNQKAEKYCHANGLKIQFEYTPPGTPQRNGRIERKFATYCGRIHACHKSAGILDDDSKYKIWAECARSVAMLDNMLTSSTKPHSPYYLFYKRHPEYLKQLHTFGEIGIVATHEDKDLRSKLAPRGKICMFVGYPDSTIPDVYRMLNLQTNMIIKSRDVI
jgi:hypothetical protein